MSGDEWTIPDLPTTPPAAIDLTDATQIVMEEARLAKTAPTRAERERHADRVAFGRRIIESVEAGFRKTDAARQAQQRRA